MQIKFQCQVLLLIKIHKKVVEMGVELQVMQAAFHKQVKNQENKVIKKKERNLKRKNKLKKDHHLKKIIS